MLHQFIGIYSVFFIKLVGKKNPTTEDKEEHTGKAEDWGRLLALINDQ